MESIEKKLIKGSALIELSTMNILSLDDNFANLIGGIKGLSLPFSLEELLSPEEYERFSETVKIELSDKDYFSINLEISRSSGFSVLLSCDAYAVQSEKGKQLRIFCSDISGMRKGLMLLQKKSDEAAKQAFLNTKKLIQALPAAIYVVEASTMNIIYYNDHFHELVPSAVIGEKCFKTCAGNDFICEECPITKLNESNRQLRETYEWFLNGRKVLVDRFCSQIEWGTYKDAFIIQQSEHYSLTKESELVKRSEQLEEKYAFIFKNSCDYIVNLNLTNHSVNMVLMNKNFPYVIPIIDDNYDKTFEYIYEKYIFPADREKVRNLLSIDSMSVIFSSGTKTFVEEFRYIVKNGDLHWNEFRVFYLNDTIKPSVAISFRDITEIRRNEEASRLEMKRLYTVTTNVFDVIIYLNLTRDTYSMRLVKDTYTKRASKNGEIKALVDNFIKSVHPDDVEIAKKLFCERIVRTFSGGENEINCDLRVLAYATREYHWIKITVLPADVIGSEDNMAVAMVKHIDDQKQTEQALADALKAAENANSAKSDFLARMSHDIRTPMNAIIGMTIIAKKNIDNRDKAMECLEKVDVSSKYLLSLINDILDMSRIESGKMVIEKSPIDIRKLIDEITTIIAPQTRDKEQNFSCKAADIFHNHIFGDNLRVKQILINLLSNAVKFTPSGGSVIFHVVQSELKRGWINMNFIISDDGIGMSEDMKKRAFQPFEQGESTANNYGGSGLGLSICSNLIKMMNGTIKLSSQKEIGTTFVVNIPFELDDARDGDVFGKETESSENESDEFDEQKLSGICILLAEDDEINSEIAITILEDKGIKVIRASNGKEAVEKFSASSTDYYDAILMDIQMPLMSGYEAATEIRSMIRLDAKTVPIIAMTANAFIEDINAAKQSGMNSHVSKPINPKELYKQLYKFAVQKENQ